MTDIVLGVLAVLVGALLCFGGQVLLRLTFPIWGAFAGFAFGAGLVAGLAEERFLGSVLGWVLGIVFAVAFALVAYLYYAVAVILLMASIGFTLGSGLVVALGIDWSWVAVLAGVAVGTLVGLAAALADLPAVLLVLISAVAGAVTTVAGLMLLVGALRSDTFTDGTVTTSVDDAWWWYALLGGLAVAGTLAQLRSMDAARSSAREAWADAGV